MERHIHPRAIHNIYIGRQFLQYQEQAVPLTAAAIMPRHRKVVRYSVNNNNVYYPAVRLVCVAIVVYTFWS